MSRIINNEKCYHHHTAAARGYISRKIDELVKEYNGKFGRGYKVMKPRFDTTQYIYVEYWIVEE